MYTDNTNNFKIYTIGKENLIDILTLNEKADIMKSRFSCLERIVEIAHCSKYDQFYAFQARAPKGVKIS